jgi:hypothetical protein
MGFYASRPRVKRVCKELNHKLVLAEQLAAQSQNGVRAAAHEAIEAAWDLVAIANHHDFITGTSPDAVHHAEQLPWLSEAGQHVELALEKLRPKNGEAGTDARSWRQSGGLSGSALERPSQSDASMPRWRKTRDGVEVQTEPLSARGQRAAGRLHRFAGGRRRAVGRRAEQRADRVPR